MAPDIFLGDRYAVLSILWDHESHQAVAAWLVVALHEAVVIAVVDFADLDAAKIEAKVLPRHPERSIRRVFNEPNDSLELWSPKIGLIAPVPVPFEVAPRVPKLDKPYLLSILVPHYCGP